MMRFNNKVAVVTGGAQGMGKAVAELMAAEGAHVVVADVQQQKALETANSIRAAGGSCEAMFVDMSDVESITTLVENVVKALGRIDVLVNCAGIYSVKPVEELTPADWDRTMAINLKGLFFLSQKAIGVMKRQGSGSIVNFSSLSGKLGGIFAGADYSASKAGVDCLTRALAKYSAQFGIRVNAVSPGAINTTLLSPYSAEQVAMLAKSAAVKRLGEPVEVARAVVFLASDDASYITGETLDVNGGMHMD